MPCKDFICKQCGSCCRYEGCFHTTITEEEYDKLLWCAPDEVLDWVFTAWQEEDKDEPLGYVGIYDIWVNPDPDVSIFKVQPDRCPWLKWVSKGKYKCVIQDCKPNICRNFPIDREHAERPEGIPCKGYNHLK